MSSCNYFDEFVPIVVIKSLFQKYDTKKKGYLSEVDVYILLEDNLGLSRDVAEAYDLLIDKNADRKISFYEFQEWIKSGEMSRYIGDNSRYSLMIAAIQRFEKYDVDNSRAIDRNEFKKLHTDLGGHPEYVDYALNTLDRDRNGVISVYEFLRYLNWIDLGKW